MGVMAVVTVLAYRRIAVAGRLMVVLWAGMLVTVAWVIITGVTHSRRPGRSTFPPDAWHSTSHVPMGLGMALAIAMYDFLGYYQICYLGDEVADPAPDDSPIDHDLRDRRSLCLPGHEHRHPRRVCPGARWSRQSTWPAT